VPEVFHTSKAKQIAPSKKISKKFSTSYKMTLILLADPKNGLEEIHKQNLLCCNCSKERDV